MVAPNKTEKKTIIFIAGGNGAGKSTLARALTAFYSDLGVQCALYDADDYSPSLLRFYPSAQRVSATTGGLAAIWNHATPVAIVDLGANFIHSLRDFDTQTGLITRSSAHRIVICYALAPNVASVALLKLLTDHVGRRATYVIARCDSMPGTWDFWDASKTRQLALNKLRGEEIHIPALDADAYSRLDRFGVSWPNSVSDDRIGLGCACLVLGWHQRVFSEFTKSRLLSVAGPRSST
ncbi:zeta toxin family protein [Oleiharenicola sp. Vm1]|uniref:zeta toxin family protein n=1 Tax=Oleiharenicola sp. Vm1 TaxID=3398393 RepID=UPI0039F505CE